MFYDYMHVKHCAYSLCVMMHMVSLCISISLYVSSETNLPSLEVGRNPQTGPTSVSAYDWVLCSGSCIV